MSTVKTYKCELGKCALINKCGGLNGELGEKLVRVVETPCGVVIYREEFYECARFRKRNSRRKISETKWGR